MKTNDILLIPEELLAALSKCVHCGRCLSVCPVYAQTLWEGSVARGKLALLRAELAGEADLEAKMKNLLSHCLLCGACAEGCASGVKADELIQRGRTLAMKSGGLDKLKGLLLRDVLGQGPLVRNLYHYRSWFLKKVPEDSGLHFRFPLPGWDPHRWLPRPADQPFLSRSIPAVSGMGPGPRVALFVGCVANYLAPDTAQAAVNLLTGAGCRVVIPKDQVCCGKPAAGAGDEGTALFLAQKNLAVFDPTNFDYLVTFCATCSEQLKDFGRRSDLPAGGGLAEKVIDFSQLLDSVLAWTPTPKKSSDHSAPQRVFYHDPCHLRRKQGIWQQPRRLIASLPGVELVGADASPVCCGYGGVFNLWHYQLSREIFLARAKALAEFRPDLVVTACSGCWLQFEDFQRNTDQPFKVMPLVNLLAERGLAPV